MYIKKLLFIRNIANLKEDSIYRKVFNQRLLVYANNKILSRQNRHNSPTFDILRISEIFDIYEEVNMMLHGTRYYTKSQWKELVWSKAWDLDRQDWHFRKTVFRSTMYLNKILIPSSMLIWWQLAAECPELMHQCETMVKLICGASKLKYDHYHFKRDKTKHCYCDCCMDLKVENVEHIIMYCPALNTIRESLLIEIHALEEEFDRKVIGTEIALFDMLLGKCPMHIQPEMLLRMHRVIAMNVHKMYCVVLKSREGIG